MRNIDFAKQLQEEEENIFRLQQLVADLEKRLALAQGRLGHLQRVQTTLPEDPKTTPTDLAENRSEMEQVEKEIQGLTADKENVERTLDAAHKAAKKARREHFRQKVQPEKSRELQGRARDIAQEMVDQLPGLKERVKQLVLDNEAFQNEGRRDLEVRVAEAKSQRWVDAVEVATHQTVEIWEGVLKGMHRDN